MKKYVGIFYISPHGQTRKIANYLAEWFRTRHSAVRLIDLDRSPATFADILEFDAVLIGSPLYMFHYPRAVRNFVRSHREKLVQIPSTAFFSTCLTATPGTPQAYAESLGPVRAFLDAVAWNPHWIASFPGALNYREYNPLTRRIMKNISEKQGGPTDTSKDHFFTRWDDVSAFASDIYNDQPHSPYGAALLSLATQNLNRLMPAFEHRIVQNLRIKGAPDEIRSALETMQLEDMPLAEIVARVRNLGQTGPEYSRSLLFQDAAAAFGSLLIESGSPHEVIGALIGKFWKRDYGVFKVKSAAEFQAFIAPDYVKSLTNFWFDDFREGKTLVRTETRIHALSPEAARKFGWYWIVVSLGVRVYMRSVLRGIEKSLRRKRWQRHAIAA